MKCAKSLTLSMKRPVSHQAPNLAHQQFTGEISYGVSKINRGSLHQLGQPL